MLVGLVLGVLFVTPIVLTYLVFIRWADRFEPEPWWLILLAFGWGAIFATFGGGVISRTAEEAADVLWRLSPNALDAVTATIFAPVSEELFKGLGVGLLALAAAVGFRELGGALDGVIYGGVIGLGFTLTEDILYVAHQYATGGFSGFVFLLFFRTVVLGLSHCTFTACTGLGFGIAVETRRPIVRILAPVGGISAAIVMHAVHNALPTLFDTLGLSIMVVITWGIDVLFFVGLALLVARDRRTVIRELFGEVGELLHARELELVASYFALGRLHWSILRSKGWASFRVRRDKQMHLVALAFLKDRRRRGETGRRLDEQEATLRRKILEATQCGVRIGF